MVLVEILSVLLFFSAGLVTYDVRAQGMQYTNVLVDSISDVDFNSSAHFLCFEVTDAIDWPVYMVKELYVVLNVHVPDAENHDIQPVSQIITLDVRETHWPRSPVTDMDPNSLCSPSVEAPSGSPFGFISSFFYSHSSDYSKKLTTFNNVSFTFPAFPKRCVAVCRSATQPVGTLKLNINVTSNFNELSVFKCVVGVLCILSADYLSQTISFYYVSGVSFAVFGSLLIVLIIFIRMLPLHRGGAVLQGILLLLGGTFSLSCMLLEYMRSTILELLSTNAEYTILYVIIVASFSFILLYWFHLPDVFVHKYPRTTVIMKYALRITGAALIICSISLPFDEVTFLYSIISFVSSFYSDADNTTLASLSLASYAPKIVRVLLIGAVVLFVDILDRIYNSPTVYKQHKRRKGFLSPAVTQIHHRGSTFPGSPWASSSPYNGLPKNEHIRSPYRVRRSGLLEDFDSHSVHCRRSVIANDLPHEYIGRKSLSRYDWGSRYPQNSSYDFLTDDEDD